MVGDGLASLKPGQFFLAPCGQHLGTGDALEKLESKVYAEIVTGQPHMVGKKALRSSMLYIQKDERGNKCRKRGVGNANDVKKEFKKGKFPQFDKVVFFDSSGGLIRKRGQAEAKAKPEPKK